MRALVALMVWPVLLAGCTTILGVDQDYTVGTFGGGGAVTPTSSTSSHGGGGLGAGGTGTGTGATGGTGTGTGATGGTGTGTGATGGTGAGGSGGGEEVVFVATVADCIDTTAPDPDACAEPAEALWIDDLGNGSVTAYLRFEPDGTTAGAEVQSVTLVLTVGTYSQAQGDTTGEVWQVVPFERSDLFVAAPATIGARLAGNSGEANPGTAVSWSLPTSLVSPNTPLCLAVVPVSFNSVGYLNLNGTSAPQLVVRYQ